MKVIFRVNSDKGNGVMDNGQLIKSSGVTMGIRLSLDPRDGQVLFPMPMFKFSKENDGEESMILLKEHDHELINHHCPLHVFVVHHQTYL